MKNNNTFKVFVDFDGTITKIDVGEELFIEFGDKENAAKLIKEWNEGNVLPRIGWQKLCDWVVNIDKEAMKKFVLGIEIDSTFPKFVEYCEQNEFEVLVVSDGFDYYIKRILERENLGHLKFSSNQLLFGENNKLIPRFPNAAEDCTCSANCKRNFVLNNSSDDEYTIYIGDGVSDRCPVQYCDFIFAKDSLLRFCEMNRITFFPFTNFDDVVSRMEELKNKKRLKKRYQAELKRREAYMME